MSVERYCVACGEQFRAISEDAAHCPDCGGDPIAADGAVSSAATVIWIDGKPLGHWKGIGWRKAAGLRANAFTLESYVTDRWTKNAVNVVLFDGVVIARKYIGPAAAPRR